ncbi:MAG TPA: hypothetical protein VIW64_16215 [Pyrinomonadaceae bacterium]|jgi:hypothetical protein
MTTKISGRIFLAIVAIVGLVTVFATSPSSVKAAANWALARAGSTISIDDGGTISLAPKSGKAVAVTRALNVAGVTAANGGASIGSGGATIAKVLTGTASVDFTALAAGTCETFTVTVTGAANGDAVSVGIPAAAWATTEYATINAFVSAGDTVTVKRCNLTNTTTALSNPPAVTIRATVFQF